MSVAQGSTPTAALAGKRCLEGTSALSQFAEILVAMDFVHGQTCVRAPMDNSLPTVAQLESKPAMSDA